MMYSTLPFIALLALAQSIVASPAEAVTAAPQRGLRGTYGRECRRGDTSSALCILEELDCDATSFCEEFLDLRTTTTAHATATL
jgi:hypothetical protein